MRFLIINGPNLNLLGVRERNIYGTQTYAELHSYIMDSARDLGVEAECWQSNHEGEIVDKIQSVLREPFDGIVINPAAYTHTSIAILDALKAVAIPAVEVHLSDISAREDFRRVSYAGRACICTVTGKGFEGYRDAMQRLIAHRPAPTTD